MVLAAVWLAGIGSLAAMLLAWVWLPGATSERERHLLRWGVALGAVGLLVSGALAFLLIGARSS